MTLKSKFTQISVLNYKIIFICLLMIKKLLEKSDNNSNYWIFDTVKSRFYRVFGRQQKVYKIEIVNTIEIFYLLLVTEGTQ